MDKIYYELVNETIYTEKLDNGLHVYLLPRKEMAKTYGIFTTKYGSIDREFVPLGESNMITVPDGVAHFLEHKLFEKKSYDVFTKFSQRGASANAYTTFTKTAYLFSATSHIGENVETLLDFVQDPYFSEQSVEKEKGIIAQEIQMYNDQPDWRSFMGILKAMFKYHPVKIDIAGTVESIYSITKEDLYTCYNTFYHPENMLLFVAGNFEPERMIELIRNNQARKDFKPFASIQRRYPNEPEHVAVKENNIVMPVSIPKIIIGNKESSGDLEKNDFITKDLLQGMLLDHYFSKGGDFYHTLYDQQLIDDSFYFQTTLEKNFGFSIIGGNTTKPEKFVETMKKLLSSLKTTSLTEDTVERMKRKKTGQLLRAMNSLEYIANHYLHYKIVDIEFFDLLEKIASFTIEDVQTFMNDWFHEDRIAICKINAK